MIVMFSLKKISKYPFSSFAFGMVDYSTLPSKSSSCVCSGKYWVSLQPFSSEYSSFHLQFCNTNLFSFMPPISAQSSTWQYLISNQNIKQGIKACECCGNNLRYYEGRDAFPVYVSMHLISCLKRHIALDRKHLLSIPKCGDVVNTNFMLCRAV